MSGSVVEHSTLLFVVLSFVVGCAHSGPVIVASGEASPVPCVDRLIARSRSAGYIETAVDREAGFLRVEIRPKKARAGAVFGYFINLQCSPDGSSATLSATDGGETFGPERRATGWVRHAIADMAAKLAGF